MKNIVSFIAKHGATICALTLMVAPSASKVCKFILYQPAEPEGFAEFAKRK